MGMAAVFLTACTPTTTDTNSGMDLSGEESSTTASADAALNTSEGELPDQDGVAQDPAANAASVLWSVNTPAVTGPVLLEDTLVLYTIREDGHLMLTGIDADTGEERWSRTASISDVDPLRPLQVEVFDGAVVHLQPDGDEAEVAQGKAQVLTREARSGLVARSGSRGYSSTGISTFHPSACVDDLELLCMVFRTGDGVDAYALDQTGRIDRWRPEGGQERGQVERVGPLELNRGRQGLGRFVDGALAWAVDPADFVAPPAEVLTGANFVAFEDELLIGSVGMVDETSLTADFSLSAVFALDPDSGAVEWIEQGSDLQCNSPVYEASGTLLACAFSQGTFDWDESGRRWTGATAELVRLDERTGEQLWSTTVLEDAEVEGLVTTGLLDDDHVAVRGTVIATADGSARERTEHDQVWFVAEGARELDSPGSLSEVVQGVGLWVLPHGTSVEEPPTWPLPTGVGVELEDGSRVIAHSDGLIRLAGDGTNN